MCSLTIECVLCCLQDCQVFISLVECPDTTCAHMTLRRTLILIVCLRVRLSVHSLVEYPDTIAIDGLPGCWCQERCDEMECDGQTIITRADVYETFQTSVPLNTYHIISLWYRLSRVSIVREHIL